MVLSDENDDAMKETLSDDQKELLNQKVLGYKKDYMDQVTEVAKVKEKPGNSQNLETPRIVTPLEFQKIKIQDIFKDDREHYFMD